jgi:hypothetical protein
VRISKGAPRQLALALLVLAAGVCIAACGSSSGSSSSTTTAASGTPAASTTPGSTSRAKLEACLKQHGVTLPSGFGQRRNGGGPPPGGGGGFFGGGGSGSGTGSASGQTNRSRFFNSKTAAAFKACGAQFGGRFGAGGRRFRLSHTKINQYVACVRKNGYDLPNPNFSGKGPIFPANIRTNKQFQAASKKCQSILVSPPPSGSGGSTGASGSTTGA